MDKRRGLKRANRSAGWNDASRRRPPPAAPRSVPAWLGARLHLAAGPIAQRGLDQTGIDDLSAASGIPPATLHSFFAGPDDILAFLLSDFLDAMAEAVTAAAAGRGRADERLRAVIRAQLGVMAAHPDLCRALLAEPGRAGPMPDIARAIAAAVHQPVLQLLHDGVHDGSLRHLRDPTVAARAIFGAVVSSGLADLLAAGTVDVDRVSRHVADLVVHGVAASR